MVDNSYIESIFNSIGVMINEGQNQEILYFFPLVYNEKNLKYQFKNEYTIVSQPLGTYFTDFLNTDFEDLDEFKDFFTKYAMSILTNNYQKVVTKCTFSEDEYNVLINEVFSKNKNKLLKIQHQLDQILDYCIINPRNRKVDYTPLDRFLVLQSTRESFTLLRKAKMELVTFYGLANERLAHKKEDEIYELLKNNTPEKYFVYIPTSLESFINFLLCHIIENKLHLKICKNCHKYFLTQNSKTNYCDNIVLGSDNTCKELGRNITFHNNIDDDPLLKRYYKIYYKKSVLARRYPDIQEYVKDFNNYKKFGKNKIAAYKANKISEEEFNTWLDKKDK